MTAPVALDPQVREAIVGHARWCAPHEACGLLAVDAGDRVRMAYCLTNVDASPERFTVAPHEHLGALRHAERNGWVIAGSFHSHPAAPAVPSGRDVAGALDPTWLYLIAGPLPDPEVNAYRIVDGSVIRLATGGGW